MTDEKKDYGATMRIDISPEMLKALQPGGRATPKLRQSAQPDDGQSNADSPLLIRMPTQKAPSLEDFQVLLQNLYDAVLLTTPDGRILNANPRAELFFASTKESLCQRNIIDLIMGADASLLDTIAHSLSNQRFVLIQAACPRADGTSFPSEISVVNIPLVGKKHLGFFVRDITVRKENEERLKTGYNALENSGSGIAVTEIDGTLSGYLNPAMRGLLGFEENEDAAHINFRAFMVHPEIADEIQDALTAGRRWEGELDMKRKDGGLFYAQAAMELNLNPDGETTGVVVSVLDVTPQRQAQIQLADYAHQLRQRNAEMEADLRMAREVQMAFLPATYPDVRGISPGGIETALHFSHVYHPSGLVGGDFFDITQVSPSEVLIFMADVMGHGPRAALVVATIRGLIEQIALATDDAAEFMTALNADYSRIFGHTGELMFATGMCARIKLHKGELQICHAGHPMPVLRDATGAIRMGEMSDELRGPAIGLLPDTKYQSLTRPIGPGERILFYTDGLTEARSKEGREFGENGLLEAFQKNNQKSLAELLHNVLRSVVKFTGSPDFEDDVCILGVECTLSVEQEKI